MQAVLDEHQDLRRGSVRRVHDANAVIRELQLAEHREGRPERFHEGMAERVDRTVALRHAEARVAGDVDLHGRLHEIRLVARGADAVNAVVEELERRAPRPEVAADEQIEAAVGGLVRVPRILPLDDFAKDRRDDLVVGEPGVAMRELRKDVASPRELAHEDTPRVADRRRRNVLVGPLVALHRAHVDAALVGERGDADVRLIDGPDRVEPLPHHPAELRQTREVPLRQADVAELQLQVRDDGREIHVAAALADAVDRPLHLHAAALHGGKGVRDGEAAVVVHVNAELRVG